MRAQLDISNREAEVILAGGRLNFVRKKFKK